MDSAALSGRYCNFDSSISTDDICLIEGTVQIPAESSNAIKIALANAKSEVDFNNSECFAPIDLRDDGEWWLVSFVGLVNFQPTEQWSVFSNGVWSDNVIIHFTENNILAAVAGTKQFSQELANIPESIFSQEAKDALDPLSENTSKVSSSESFIFPF